MREAFPKMWRCKAIAVPARLTKPASAIERKRSPNIVAAHAAVKSPNARTQP